MKTKELIIIGAGAAGLTSAIYASRAMLDFCVIEKAALSGGQIINTSEIDNYPGFISTTGSELSIKLREHAEACDTGFIQDNVLEIRKENGIFSVKCEKEAYLSKAVIAACGAVRRKLGAEGEKRLSGSGVSYCAVCDGAFFKNKTVTVVGGGNTAAEEALYLSKIARKVYLVHRRDKLRAGRALQIRINETPNIQLVFNSTITEITGENKVSGICLDQNGSSSFINTDGVFIAIGISPQSELLKGLAELDKQGFIIARENCETSLPGLFAAGDIRTKPLRQIVTAAADGAAAVSSAEKYLNS